MLVQINSLITMKVLSQLYQTLKFVAVSQANVNSAGVAT